MAKKPNTIDDIGFDEQGRPFVLGDEARAGGEKVFDRPDAKPLLIVAETDHEVAVRTFGPPSWETVDKLTHVVAVYRQAVEAALGPRQ